MASCYVCGCSGADYRRTVSTGYSVGSWISKRSYGSGSRRYYGLRTVCERCAADIDKSNIIQTVVILVIIAGVLLYFVLK